jgi:hypothetical protein
MKGFIVVCAVAFAAFAAGACGEDGPDKRAGLTQREKDSILGQSQIPGAKAVKTGMTNADSASARQARLDSAEREP